MANCKQSDRKFIAMWCCEGLESLVEITNLVEKANDCKKTKMFDIIKKPDSVLTNTAMTELNLMLFAMIMRARSNPQRHYEIYMVTTPRRSFNEKTLRDMFNANPQGMVDLFREKGVKIYSDRARNKPAIV